MAYRNQNYMTNKKIKQEVDKNQKGYVDPEQQEEETPVFTPVIYNFTSYSDENKTVEWGTGTVQTTETQSNGFTKVKVLTNSSDQSFVNRELYITSDAKTNGTAYPLYSDAGTTAIGVYVTITASSSEEPK